MKRLVALLGLTLLVPAQAAAQSGAEGEVNEVIVGAFDAMRAGDASALADAFHSEARLISVSESNGDTELSITAMTDFISAVGKPHDEVWDERIWDMEIRIDGNLATALMQYAFHLDDTLSHCGVNAIDLMRTSEGWKIIHVTDTRRMDGCVVP